MNLKLWIALIIIIIIVIAIIILNVRQTSGPDYQLSNIKNLLNINSSVDDLPPTEDDLPPTEDDLPPTEDDLPTIEDESSIKDNDYSDQEIESEEDMIYQSLVSSGIKRSKPEQICKKTLEEIYGKKFSRVKPDWLINPKTGRRLELDCYNEELEIALEYHGIQHYIWPNFTKMTKQEFLNQNMRDNLKIDICEERGIYLITVPYNIPYDRIRDFIYESIPPSNKNLVTKII